MVQGFWVKCKAKREIQNPTNITLKNGKPAIKGTCPVCGKTIIVIGKKL